MTIENDFKLEYLIDITVAYPEPSDPLDVLSILNGIRPPCDTHLYYRIYPINQVSEWRKKKMDKSLKMKKIKTRLA